MKGVTIVDKDRGYSSLMQTVREFSRGASVSVGVTEAPHEGSPGKSIADIGKYHEFGIGVPQRSFLRGWIDENTNSIRSQLRGVLTGALFGVTGSRRALENFGRWAVKGVQARILKNIPPPLEDDTVQRKHHDLALVESRQLLDGIIYEISDSRGSASGGAETAEGPEGAESAIEETAETVAEAV